MGATIPTERRSNRAPHALPHDGARRPCAQQWRPWQPRTSRRTSSSTGRRGRRSRSRCRSRSTPTRSSGCAVSATSSTSMRWPRSTCRSRGCSASTSATSARCTATTTDFLGDAQQARTPFVIGIAGSVAVGKSTTARLLRELLAHWPEHPNVSLVTTDGFLYPNAELESRGLLERKGFPESYDRRALLQVRDRHQVRQGDGHGAGLLPPRVRRDARQAARVAPARHRLDRGAQRAPAGPGRPRRDTSGSRCATSSTSRCTSTPPPTTSGAGTPSASCGCARPPSATRRRTSSATRTCRCRRRSPRPSASGTRSTAPTSTTTSSRRASRATLVLRKDADHSVRYVRLRKL